MSSSRSVDGRCRWAFTVGHRRDDGSGVVTGAPPPRVIRAWVEPAYLFVQILLAALHVGVLDEPPRLLILTHPGRELTVHGPEMIVGEVADLTVAEPLSHQLPDVASPQL